MTDPGRHLESMRAQAPLVQCVTNFVAMEFAANAVLAAGASPAMLHAPEEAGEFAAIAGALTVNIGTLDALWLEGMLAAARGARAADRPWALDPVAAFATRYRREGAARLLAERPTVVRGNASEILGLAGAEAAGKGADAGDEVDAAEPAARALAGRIGGVVAVTGARDLVTDGTRVARIGNGHPLLPRITASGCALTAVLGAFLAAGDDPFEATVAALVYFGLAGERAAAAASGPGTFRAALPDALAALDGDAVTAGARVSA